MEQKIRIFTQSVKWSARAQHTAKRIKNEKQNEENKEENCWSAARTLGGCHRSLSWRNQINAIIAKSKNEAHFSTQYVQSLRTLKLKRFPIQFGKFLNSTMSPDTRLRGIKNAMGPPSVARRVSYVVCWVFVVHGINVNRKNQLIDWEIVWHWRWCGVFTSILIIIIIIDFCVRQ